MRHARGDLDRTRTNSLESSTEEGGEEGDVSSSNEMPQLELKRTGEGDGEEGIVDNSLRADVRRGEGREEEEGGRLGCDGKGAAYRVIDVKVDTKVSIGM